MSTLTTDFTPAWQTHEDGQDAGVRQRLEGCAALGGGVVGTSELKACMKQEADNGCDPTKGGALELGLMLPEDDYEYLKEYAKSLTVVHGKRRRRV